MKAREGDLIETDGHLIFDVKGLVHPSSRIVAFIRYFPDKKGVRARDGRLFSKVYSLSKRYELLKDKFPDYLVYDPIFDETLCEVPTDKVRKRYDPAAKLQEMRKSKELDVLQSKALQFAELLKEAAGIPWNTLGISGSILVGLQSRKSDIDLIVYGSRNCRKANSALKSMLADKHKLVKAYTRQDLKSLFDFRSKDTETGFEDFLQTEQRKVMQGKFTGTDYFVRFVKEWNEIVESYGDVQYKNAGNARIEAKVIDDSESAFTPCTYNVEDVKLLKGFSIEGVTEVASFRGRFCEQARKGETIVAAGKVEHVADQRRNHEHYRILVGSKPADYIILKR